MNKFITPLVAGFALASMSLADSGSSNCSPCNDDDDVTAESVFAAIGDVLVVRPLGAVGTVGGFGIFAVASPFAAMAGATDEVFDTLVKNPGEYTFERDLGDFSK